MLSFALTMRPRALLLLLLLGLSVPAEAGERQTIARAADLFARSAVDSGATPGVAVGVVFQGRIYAYTFGYSDFGRRLPFAKDSIFQIGSNTKVFTTNLLGQAVYRKRFALSDRLGDFPAELGPLNAEIGSVTLRQLGDFTAGLPSYAPLCENDAVPGCRPNSRPTLNEYGASDFLAYFAGTVPRNYNLSPPAPAPLPVPYFYSDYSTGLLGLLLAARPGQRIDDDALARWYRLVRGAVLEPLGMSQTFLELPSSLPAAEIASGYARARAEAVVTNGQITDVRLLDGGAGYATSPRVRILGGGGSGASVGAQLAAGSVSALAVRSSGAGYLAPPRVTLNEGGSTLTAETRAIVRDGRIAAIEIVKPGAGYQRAPVVTIEGGRLGGSDARGVARIANGIVVEIKVVDGGSGYLPSLTVWVEPGEPTSNAIPIWAPAGALSSTVEDMARFAAAALGASQVDGRPVPLVLRQGFRVAQTAWACTGESPSLASCPAGVTRAGFAWAIRPADLTNRVPEIIVKDGLLGGYSSQIMLARSRKLAVVVLANNATGPEDAPAPHVAANMLYHLLSALPK